MKSLLALFLLVLSVPMSAWVTVDSTTTTKGAFTTATIPHTVAGNNKILSVSVSVVPKDGQEVLSVKFGSSNLTRKIVGQVSASARQEIWILKNPPTGTDDVEVYLLPLGKAIISITSFAGVDQTEPIYFSTSGMGADVQQLSVKVDTLAGSSLIGYGIAVGDAKAATVMGQTQVWDALYNNDDFRSEGILSPMTYTAKITVRNTLNKASDWAVCILGLKAAE